MTKPTVAIIQARASSTRLPKKVLMPLGGEPVLTRVVQRVGAAGCVDLVVVATSTEPSDNAVVDICRQTNTQCVRGSLDDVLDRFALAAQTTEAETVVRITADCPMHDPAIIDRAVLAYQKTGAPYMANVEERTYADGFDVEVFARSALDEAVAKATTSFDREHVTPFLRRLPDAAAFKHPVDLSSLRLTLDYADDYEVAVALYDALHTPSGPPFGATDTYRFLAAHPEWIRAGEGGPPFVALTPSPYVNPTPAHVQVGGIKNLPRQRRWSR